jgi:hypothetical protein
MTTGRLPLPPPPEDDDWGLMVYGGGVDGAGWAYPAGVW